MKENTPLVSVVMVVCNVDQFLREAVESILCQTFTDFEFIIVDFGSTDNSRAIIMEYASKDIRVKFYAIPQCGLAEARNVGGNIATGRYIAIMDADDVSTPDRLLLETQFMNMHSEVGILGGAVDWIDSTGKELVTWGNPTGDSEIKSALLKRCPFWQPTVLMRRDAFLAVGGYRAPFAPAEDYDLWLRMAETVQCANLEHVVLKYRIHANQVSMRKRSMQTLGCLAARACASLRRSGHLDPLDSVQEITTELLVKLGITEIAQRRELASELARWIQNMFMAGEHEVALRTLMEALKSDLQYLNHRQIADLYLIAAQIYWKQRKVLSSFVAAGRAVITRPVVAGRALRPALRSFGPSKATWLSGGYRESQPPPAKPVA